MKVMAPDRAAVQVDGLSGRRYTARDGAYEMSPRDAKALVQAGGFVPSLSGTTATGTGYRCTDCGFGAFFTTCSKCGGECEKEVPADGAAQED